MGRRWTGNNLTVWLGVLKKDRGKKVAFSDPHRLQRLSAAKFS